MNIDFITLTKDNIEKEHICCAFSDKKCQESYNLKKEKTKSRLLRYIMEKNTLTRSNGIIRVKRNVMRMRTKTKMNMPGGKTRLMDIKKGATPCSNLC